MPAIVAVPSPLSVKESPDGNGPDSTSEGAGSPVVVTVNATLLSAPLAHLSAECADILEVSTVSRYCADAELTKLQTLVAAYGASIIARLGRHPLDTLLAPQDAFLAGLDTLAIGFVQLSHEGPPFLHPCPDGRRHR